MDDRIVETIYAAIDEVNEDRVDKEPVEKSLKTPIYGSDSALDSLALINFILAVEDGVDQTFGTPVVLNDDRALAREPSPFTSVEALAAYIETLLREQA